MARLTHPSAGTVVTCEGDLAERYRAAGWADADAPAQQEQVPSEKPAQRRRGRPPKTD